jgi:hypothetical protein
VREGRPGRGFRGPAVVDVVPEKLTRTGSVATSLQVFDIDWINVIY